MGCGPIHFCTYHEQLMGLSFSGLPGRKQNFLKMLIKTQQQTNKHSSHRQQPRSHTEFYSRWKLFSKKNYCWILLLNIPAYLLTTENLWDPGPRWEMEHGLRAQTLSRFPPDHSWLAGAELPPDLNKQGCFPLRQSSTLLSRETTS